MSEWNLRNSTSASIASCSVTDSCRRPIFLRSSAACAELGLALDLDNVHYIIGHVDLLAGRKRHGMVLWRDKLFAFLARNTQDITATYHIPAGQVMTVGLQVGI